MVVDATAQIGVVMTVIHKVLLVLAFVYGFFSFSYAGKDVERIKKVIKIYNNIVIQESKTDRHRDLRTFVKMMEDVTTENVARKLYIWIQSWHENGLFMDSKILKLKFLDIKINGEKAKAITEENWKYKYFDRRINKIVVPETDIFYKVEYNLIRKKNRWIISKIKVLEEKKEQEGKR